MQPRLKPCVWAFGAVFCAPKLGFKHWPHDFSHGHLTPFPLHVQGHEVDRGEAGAVPEKPRAGGKGACTGRGLCGMGVGGCGLCGMGEGAGLALRESRGPTLCSGSPGVPGPCTGRAGPLRSCPLCREAEGSSSQAVGPAGHSPPEPAAPHGAHAGERHLCGPSPRTIDELSLWCCAHL